MTCDEVIDAAGEEPDVFFSVMEVTSSVDVMAVMAYRISSRELLVFTMKNNIVESATISRYVRRTFNGDSLMDATEEIVQESLGPPFYRGHPDYFGNKSLMYWYAYRPRKRDVRDYYALITFHDETGAFTHVSVYGFENEKWRP